MELLITSFFAGVLTILAPCILPLLPVIVGGSLPEHGKKPYKKALTITASLAISVLVFSLLLKATTALLGVPQMVWQTISGVIVLLFGLNLLFPIYWDKLMVKTRLNIVSTNLMIKSNTKEGTARDILLGASLGPVFSSCSPTYALIVAVVLPQSFAKGFIYLVAYSIGLALALLVIALAGQKLITRLGWATKPNGLFMRMLGITFILVGIAVMTGYDKDVQTYILEGGFYDWVSNIEQSL